MIRFFLLVFLIMLFGVSTLSTYSPESVNLFVFLIVGVVGAAAILKIALDFYLYYKEEESDDENREVLGSEEGKTYYDIGEYSRATRRRSNHR